MQSRETHLDQRAKRTRDAILRAFTQLAFERRYELIRIADLVATANIGRATFYDHFDGKDDVMLAATEPILLPLANAASGQGAEAHIRMMLSHLWEKRSIGRIILNSAAGAKLQRRLAVMIHARIKDTMTGDDLALIQATAAASAQMAMLRSWIAGETSCSVKSLSDQMINCSKLVSGRKSSGWAADRAPHERSPCGN